MGKRNWIFVTGLLLVIYFLTGQIPAQSYRYFVYTGTSITSAKQHQVKAKSVVIARKYKIKKYKGSEVRFDLPSLSLEENKPTFFCVTVIKIPSTFFLYCDVHNQIKQRGPPIVFS